MNCECEQCKRAKEVGMEQALQERKDWEAGLLEKHGWYSHAVIGLDAHGMCNFHTHGLNPDFQVVLPVDPIIAQGILHNLADRQKEGEVMKDGDTLDKVIKDFPVKLVKAVEGDDHPVLRVILPDEKGQLEYAKMKKPYRNQYLGLVPTNMN